MYEVGDKVKIRVDLHKDSYWCGSGVAVTEDMVRYAGEEVTISKVRHNRRYSIEEDKGAWTWHETMFDRLITTEPTEYTTAKKSDAVSHPSHYTDGRIEVIDFIQDKKLDFARGNVVKYISRAGKKGGSKAKEIEDLKKAKQYCEFAIRDLEGRV